MIRDQEDVITQKIMSLLPAGSSRAQVDAFVKENFYDTRDFVGSYPGGFRFLEPSLYIRFTHRWQEPTIALIFVFNDDRTLKNVCFIRAGGSDDWLKLFLQDLH